MNDSEKLNHLIGHWIEHNDSHAAEFAKWAERAREDVETKARGENPN